MMRLNVYTAKSIVLPDVLHFHFSFFQKKIKPKFFISDVQKIAKQLLYIFLYIFSVLQIFLIKTSSWLNYR